MRETVKLFTNIDSQKVIPLSGTRLFHVRQKYMYFVGFGIILNIEALYIPT